MIRARSSFTSLVIFCFFNAAEGAPHQSTPLLTLATQQITFKKIRPADVPELIGSTNNTTMEYQETDDQELANQKISLATYAQHYAKIFAIAYCIDRLGTVAHELGHATVGTLLGGRVAEIHIPLLPFSNVYCQFSEMPHHLPELMSAAGPCAGALCAYGVQRMFPHNIIVQALTRAEIRSNFYNFIPVHLNSGIITDGARIVESIAERTNLSLPKQCPTIPTIMFEIGTRVIDKAMM